MIIEEIIENRYVRHYSDSGFKMEQKETGILYDDAVDVLPCRYTYEETDIPIPVEPIDEEEDMRNALEILGVTQ